MSMFSRLHRRIRPDGQDQILLALSRHLRSELVCRGHDAEILDEKNADPVMAEDVYMLEMSLIDKLSKQDLGIRILSFREILKNLSTDDYFSSASKLFIQDLAKAEEEELKCELRSLCGRLYRRYSLATAVEMVRMNVARSIIVIAVILSLPLLMHLMHQRLPVAVFAIFPIDHFSVGYLVAMMAGASGAAVSAIMRLYDLDVRNEPLLTWLSLEKSSLSVWVAPVLGAIFACVLMLVFYSQAMAWSMAPDFSQGWWSGMKFDPDYCDPAAETCAGNRGYADMAKVVLWSFGAGWAERLVPDALNKLTNRGKAATGPGTGK
jgi:hypothetical protein